ncbi:hypothetical protein SCALM49S_03539 [Streptomyces californicus]
MTRVAALEVFRGDPRGDPSAGSADRLVPPVRHAAHGPGVLFAFTCEALQVHSPARRRAEAQPWRPFDHAGIVTRAKLESGGRDGQLSSTDARLYRALSGSLATATGPDSPIGSPGGVTSAWTSKLITTARDGNGLPARHPGSIGGGSATLKDLTDLMAADAGENTPYVPNKGPKEKSSPWKKDEGDPVYSEAFLTEVGDTIRDGETGDDDAYDGVMKNWQGTQEDPMKGLLNAMSRNPSAATHYFDPNATDNLAYFLEDRKWPGGTVESEMPDEKQYTSARAELGLALEAASTGRAPGSDMHRVPAHHDVAETAIFERVMSEYTTELRKDQTAVPVSMRLPMADMIADYGSDVHQILGKEMDGATDFNQLEIDRGDLTRIIRATAEDPQAYKMIHASRSMVISEGLSHFPAESFREEDQKLRAWVQQSGDVLLPPTFRVVERKEGSWGLVTGLHPTPQDARRALVYHLKVYLPDMVGIDPKEAAVYAKAADRFAQRKRPDELLVRGKRFDLVRVERMVRIGPNGPETPRPADVDEYEPSKMHPTMDEHGVITYDE